MIFWLGIVTEDPFTVALTAAPKSPKLLMIIAVSSEDPATILISSGRDGYIEFAVNANVQANQFIKIADAETKLRLVQSSNIGTQIVGTKNLTPLFKVFGIKQGLFRKPKFIARGEQEVANEEMMAEIEFTELNYSDFE